MHHKIASSTILRAILTAAAVASVAFADSAVFAQTLIEPNSPSSPMTKPPPGAKSERAARVKSCSAFGPGFVNIPGTDACIKIGGSVTTEIGR